ncbi:MAG TPA: hypothetical protein VK157_04380 [Phycisphaerales bacterium]|nr:hypothetical protein [Phycisphaerales bacterium]
MSSVSATFADGLRRVGAAWREFVAIPNLWVMLLLVLAVDLVAFSRLSRWHVPLLGIGCHTCAFGGSTFRPRIYSGMIIEKDGAYRVISRYHPEFVAMSDEAIAMFFYSGRSESVGLSAPVVTSESHNLSVQMTDLAADSDLTDEQGRTLVIDALAVETDGWYPVSSNRIAELRAGVVNRERVSPWWLLHDMIFVVLAWACLVSARAAAKELNARTVQRDVCPACGYATADLRAKGIMHCPECGQLQSL